MAKNKKPTLMEVKNVMSNIIKELSEVISYTKAIDQTVGSYIKYKKDDKKFKSWMEKKYEELKKEQDQEDNEKWQQKQDKEAK
mgnify:CR=1 FL=1|tara:strand:+ start:1390 stop:1638 length:249 start_codon:yes stop_codon:yes gene_type:complete